MVASKQISVGAGRQVLDKLVAEGGEPQAIVDAEGLAAIGGEDELRNPPAPGHAHAAARVREGNAKAIGPIVGYVMRETKGRADGTEVARLVHEQLGVDWHPARHILDFGPRQTAPAAPICRS